MNKRALFGINVFLIVVAFVVGTVFGGWLMFKADESLNSITGFFTSDNVDSNLNGLINDTNSSVDFDDSGEVDDSNLMFEGLATNGTNSS